MRLMAFASLLTALSFGQVPSGIAVTVSRTVPVPVTEARFAVVAKTPVDVSFESVLAALRGAGVTANDIESINAPGYFPDEEPEGITWTFRLTTPSADLAATLARLLATATAAPGQQVMVAYSLLSQGPSEADLEAARRSAWPQLWNDARARAATVAALAGVRLEALGALSEAPFEPPFDRGEFVPGRGQLAAPTQFEQTFWLSAQFSEKVPPGAEGIQVAVPRKDTGTPHISMIVTLHGPLTLTLNQAIATLQPLGIKAADLSSNAITNEPGAPLGVNWGFTKWVPVAQLSQTLGLLASLRARLDSTQMIYSRFDGINRIPADREASRAAGLAEGLARAKQLAHELARAAGFDLGDLLGLTDPPDYGSATGPYFFAIPPSVRYALKQ